MTDAFCHAATGAALYGGVLHPERPCAGLPSPHPGPLAATGLVPLALPFTGPREEQAVACLRLALFTDGPPPVPCLWETSFFLSLKHIPLVDAPQRAHLPLASGRTSWFSSVGGHGHRGGHLQACVVWTPSGPGHTWAGLLSCRTVAGFRQEGGVSPPVRSPSAGVSGLPPQLSPPVCFPW